VFADQAPRDEPPADRSRRHATFDQLLTRYATKLPRCDERDSGISRHVRIDRQLTIAEQLHDASRGAIDYRSLAD
jgi:hypothetical protein